MEGQVDGGGGGGGGGADSPIPGGRGSTSGLGLNDTGLGMDLDSALRLLEDEKRKVERFKQVNNSLKEQLDEAQQTNESLTNDLQKLTNDWENLREEMIQKEDEWKEEEQAFNDYYTTEHNRLLNLWRDVVGVKRLFHEMQTNCQRDLTKMKDEVNTTARDLTKACNGIATNTALVAQSEVRFAYYGLEGD